MVRDAVRVVQTIMVVVAVLFGMATLFAGGRVLMGSDPGYVVYRPLLVYNTMMGFAYVGAGLALWRNVSTGRSAAGAILVLNLIVLVGIVVMYRNSEAVAVDSVRAMTLRTVVWLALFLGAAWLVRRR